MTCIKSILRLAAAGILLSSSLAALTENFTQVRLQNTWRTERAYPYQSNLQGFTEIEVNEANVTNFESPLLHTDKQVVELTMNYDATVFAMTMMMSGQPRLFFLDDKTISLSEFSFATEVRDVKPSMTRDGKDIYFASDRFGNWEIYKANIDDFKASRRYLFKIIVDNAENNTAPALDAAGKVLAYQSWKSGFLPQIYVSNFEKKNEQAVSDPLHHCYDPKLSADGNTVVYSAVDGKNFEVLYADLKKQVNINLSDSKARDESPDVSDDGGRIVFQSDRKGDFEIYMLDMKTSTLINLSMNPKSDDRKAAVSGDGEMVAFEAAEAWLSSCIKVIDFKSKKIWNITSNRRNRYAPQMSKDGSTLIYCIEGQYYKADLNLIRKTLAL